MSVDLSRVMDEVITLKKGCPICQADIKGNDQYMFYCRRCNLLFR